MAPRGRPPLPRGVFAFDAPGWEPPGAVVLDTNVVVGALLPEQPEHSPCLALMRFTPKKGSRLSTSVAVLVG